MWEDRGQYKKIKYPGESQESAEDQVLKILITVSKKTGSGENLGNPGDRPSHDPCITGRLEFDRQDIPA